MMTAAAWPKQRSVLVIIVVFCVQATGCGVDATDEGAGVERFTDDGVPVVLSRRPELPPGSWQLEGTPIVSIGEVDGDEPYLFNGVAHAQLLPDGRIVVVDRGSSSVRVFSPEGVHLQSSGRAGEGPGEFGGSLVVHRLPGDTLAILEVFGGRVSLFEPDGTFIQLSTGLSLPSGMLSSDRWIRVRSAPMNLEPGYQQRARYVIPGSPDGDGLDTVAVLAGPKSLIVPRPTGTSVVQLPFGAADLFTVDLSRRLVFTGAGYELVFRGLDDESEFRARIARELRPVTDEAWNRAVEIALGPWRERADELGAEGAEVLRTREEALEAAERPLWLPAFDELLVDRVGRVWARTYASPADDLDAHEWNVFAVDGHWVTTVMIPVALEMLELGESHLLALRRDQFGVERVELYDLTVLE